MVLPRNPSDSTAVTVLFMMVSGGRAGGGGSPEVHDHLVTMSKLNKWKLIIHLSYSCWSSFTCESVMFRMIELRW